MLNMVEFMRDVHQNARAHGWWDKPRGMRSVRALIVSEWSEALEEDRSGRPMLWHRCADAGNQAGTIVMCETAANCPCKVDAMPESCAVYCEKPEGVAVELMDGCIRILDWLGFEKFDEDMMPGTMEGACLRGRSLIERAMIAAMDGNGNALHDADDLPLDMLVDLLTEYTMKTSGGYGQFALIQALCIACAWVQAHGVDPEKLIMLKHEFNKGRPYKHGKKY